MTSPLRKQGVAVISLLRKQGGAGWLSIGRDFARRLTAGASNGPPHPKGYAQGERTVARRRAFLLNCPPPVGRGAV